MKNKTIQKLLWIALFILIWEVIYRIGYFNPIVFPSVVNIATTFLNNITTGHIFVVLAYTLSLISIGLLIGIILAIVFSALAIKSALFKSFLDTCITIAHPLPAIALLPLLLLFSGTGTQTILLIIIHSVLWPLVVNISTGFEAVDPIHIKVSDNIGFNSFEKARHVYLPASMPFILSGLKVSWARSWRALISAEMIFGVAGSIGGLGWLIHTQRMFMDTAGLYASLITIILVGVLVESTLFTFLENKTIKKWGL